MQLRKGSVGGTANRQRRRTFQRIWPARTFPAAPSVRFAPSPEISSRSAGSGASAAGHGDTRANEIGEMRELGANQVRDLDPIPFVADEQVLIGRKRLDALGEALDEIFGISGGGLVSDGVDDAEHILGAMIDFAHEQVFLFFTLLAFGDVLCAAGHSYCPSVTPGALEMTKPLNLPPTDLAASPP